MPVVADEDIGNVIPKKRTPTKKKEETAEFTGSLKDIKCRRFGVAYVLTGIAEEIGLRKDLVQTFGEESNTILAVSIAQLMTGGPTSSNEEVMESSFIREILGIPQPFTSSELKKFMVTIGSNFAMLESLFEKRLKRCSDQVLCYDLTSVFSYKNIQKWSESGYNRKYEQYLKRMNIGLITDTKGIPLMFELYPDSITDITTLKHTVDCIREYDGKSSTLVMERNFGSADNLEYLIDTGIPFAILGKNGTKCVKLLMSQLIKMHGHPSSLRVHDDLIYGMLEADIAIVPRIKHKDNSGDDDESNDTKELELVLEDDERFAQVPPEKRIKAYVCYDDQKAADEFYSLLSDLESVDRKLQALKMPTTPVQLKKVAGEFAKYYEIRGEGETQIIEQKMNAVSFSLNRKGMFVMFTKGIESWEDMMRYYSGRELVKQDFDALKYELDGNWWKVNTPNAVKGRMIIKFVALILWSALAAKLREIKSGDPVRTMLQSLDNIMVMGKGDEWMLVGEVSKRTRMVCKKLMIPLPPENMIFKAKQYRFPTVNNESSNSDKKDD